MFHLQARWKVYKNLGANYFHGNLLLESKIVGGAECYFFPNSRIIGSIGLFYELRMTFLYEIDIYELICVCP